MNQFYSMLKVFAYTYPKRSLIDFNNFNGNNSSSFILVLVSPGTEMIFSS